MSNTFKAITFTDNNSAVVVENGNNKSVKVQMVKFQPSVHLGEKAETTTRRISTQFIVNKNTIKQEKNATKITLANYIEVASMKLMVKDEARIYPKYLDEIIVNFLDNDPQKPIYLPYYF